MIFKLSEKDRAIKHLDALFLKSKYVKIEHVPEAKTFSQIKYIHVVFAHIAEQNGDRMNDIKKHYKKEFPKYEEVSFNGDKDLLPITSLADFSKEQMQVFIDEVTIDARQCGFTVPYPDDIKIVEMYNYYRQRGIL